MKSRVLILAGIVIIIAAFGLYYFWLLPPLKITNYPSQGKDIIAFGDSLVSGYGATPGHDFVSLLSKDINASIINFGVSGDTTTQGLARINELDKYEPKVVLLLLGGNDVIQKVPQAQTFANLAEIIAYIQKKGAVVLLLGVRGTAVLGDPYANQFKKLANTYGAAYVPDVLSGLLGNPRYMSDEIHPNDSGYAIIAERIAPVLKRVLR